MKLYLERICSSKQNVDLVFKSNVYKNLLVPPYFFICALLLALHTPSRLSTVVRCVAGCRARIKKEQ